MQIPGQGFWGVDVDVILRLAAPLQPRCSLSQEVDVRVDLFIFYFGFTFLCNILFCVFSPLLTLNLNKLCLHQGNRMLWLV